jgi:hypothetical protein
MKQLSPNWITEGLMDFEYKKYVLLDYLQQVEQNFNEQKIYPALSQIIEHYKNLVLIKENKQALTNSFPNQLSGVDLKQFKLHFEKMMVDYKYVAEIEEIVDFAMPLINESLSDGKELYQIIEDKLNIFPVGIMPLDAEFGYMMLSEKASKDFWVYEYAITLFENANEKFRGIKTSYISSYTKSFVNTYENVKVDLIKTKKEFANPATFVVESELKLPLQESLLPVAKRTLVRYIFKNFGEA